MCKITKIMQNVEQIIGKEKKSIIVLLLSKKYKTFIVFKGFAHKG